MKIAITNAVLSNTGDAAIFQGIIDSLVHAGVCSSDDVIVFDANAAVTRRLYPEWTIYQQLTVAKRRKPARLGIPLQRVRASLGRRLVRRDPLLERLLASPLLAWTEYARSFRALSACDLVISSGGTYLVDHYNFAPRVLESEIVRALGKELILWTQSMGPFARPRAAAQATRISELVAGVYFRDQRSSDAWGRIDVGGVVGDVVSDVVFALDTLRATGPDAQGWSVGEEDAGVTAGGRALVSVREWGRGVDSGEMSSNAYREMMREGIRTIHDLQIEAVALSTCQGVASYAYDDSAVALDFFRGLPVIVDQDFHTPRQLLEEIAQSRLVVATRMHLAILALISRRPVIAIAYEFKTIELFESLGLGHLVIRIEDADPEWLRRTIQTVVADPTSAMLNEDQLQDLRASAQKPAVALASRGRS
ncbi:MULTISPECIES: polysaccharide pyruvyl transferase family protein [unclassified Rathayibacter]|uniref:polysaccharide pyruvyl transferase family protein n=1 Tax=unclassified Rathayibacter TaxID=2609250 RepID=UPI0010531DF5|nr:MULTISPECIES: polysaccharide pyruvyl transferase family protein [unclassified Rathayibacter]TCL84418.1 colanic acid/amylovoran biosynthesis protein [Rathayibacter sp. PhB192]TCM30136.1 colanic acid/amylovoran biosynthesis protein [Rathayibacter sp. PhB179]